jgi:hypothetical protein
MDVLIAVLGVLVGALFGVVSWVYSRRALRFERQKASAEGTFAKPQITIKLYGDECEHLLFAVPLTKGRLFIVNLFFEITNSSPEKSAAEVEAIIRMPRDLGDLGFDSPKTMKVEAQVVSRTRWLQTLLLSSRTLHPEQTIGLPLEVGLQCSTFVPITIPDLETKDGVKLRAQLTAEFQYVIDFVIMQKDQRPLSKQFRMSVIDISQQTTEGFLDEWNEKLRRRHRKGKEGLLRRILGRSHDRAPQQFRLREIPPTSVEHDQEQPFDRIAAGATINECWGTESEQGYFFPPREAIS